MYGGRIEQVGSPPEMYGSPATPFVAEFIGTMNRLVSTVTDDGYVEYAGSRLRVDAAEGLPRGERVLVLVRPETVVLEAATDGPPANGGVVGEVVSHIFLGSVTQGQDRGSRRRARAHGGHSAGPGRRAHDRHARGRELPAGRRPAAQPRRPARVVRARSG